MVYMWWSDLLVSLSPVYTNPQLPNYMLVWSKGQDRKQDHGRKHKNDCTYQQNRREENRIEERNWIFFLTPALVTLVLTCFSFCSPSLNTAWFINKVFLCGVHKYKQTETWTYAVKTHYIQGFQNNTALAQVHYTAWPLLILSSKRALLAHILKSLQRMQLWVYISHKLT